MLKKISLSAVLAFAVLLSAFAPATAEAAYVQRSGELSMLRVHDVGTGYGPSSDFMDVEVVLAFRNQPGKAYGFRLRKDTNELTHAAMVDMLRDAFENGWNVVINAEVPNGKNNGILNRVWVTR